MTFDQACNIKNPHGMSHNAKYARYAAYIGHADIRKLIPWTDQELLEAYKKDRNFNSIKLSQWDKIAGYPGAPDRQGQQPESPRGPFPRLLMSRNVTSFTASECVSLLKYVAEQSVLDAVRIGGNAGDPDTRSGSKSDQWAVFENWNANPDPMNRRDILDYDCVAVFPDEQSAIDFENKNPERRVRKLIPGDKKKG